MHFSFCIHHFPLSSTFPRNMLAGSPPFVTLPPHLSHRCGGFIF
jgi:hypothetical protein